MIDRIKRILWRLGILQDCPLCGAGLTVHGFYPHERFTCDTCDFGKPARATNTREVQRR